MKCWLVEGRESGPFGGVFGDEIIDPVGDGFLIADDDPISVFESRLRTEIDTRDRREVHTRPSIRVIRGSCDVWAKVPGVA